MLEPFSNWLSLASLSTIGLAIFSGLIAAVMIGEIARRHRKTETPRKGSSDAESCEHAITLSSVLGLLALLVAFTFSLALDRFDTRRANVLLEANAIGTTYLRAQLLEQPHRARISKLLTDYTDVRLAAATASPGPPTARAPRDERPADRRPVGRDCRCIANLAALRLFAFVP